MSARTAKKVIKSRKLRWSCPQILDDRFDVSRVLRVAIDTEGFGDTLNDVFADQIVAGNADSSVDLFSEYISLVAEKSEEERKTIAADFLKSLETTPIQLNTKEKIDRLKSAWQRFIPRLRMLSLTERDDMTAMWSRYADDYRGVVLEFEAIDEIFSMFLGARRIKYLDTRPSIDDPRHLAMYLLGFDDDYLQDLAKDMQFTKSMEWSSQKEWRLLQIAPMGESGEFTDYSFDPRGLSAVCFGEHCTVEDRDKIFAMLDGDLEHVSARKAVADDDSGRFQIHPL